MDLITKQSSHMLFHLGRNASGAENRFPADYRRELHIAADARKQYQLDESFFTISGRLVFGNFHAARVLSDRINEARGAASHPDKTVLASELVAAGLLHEIFHYVIARYVEQHPKALPGALAQIKSALGKEVLDETLEDVVERFPPLAVYLNHIDSKKYLSSRTGGTPNAQVMLEEIILIRLANENDALAAFQELIDDTPLGDNYKQLFDDLDDFFKDQPGIGSEDDSLIELLRAPARKGGKTLTDQLQFIRKNWTGLLDENFITRLLRSLDFVKEEEKARWLRFHGPHPGPPSLEAFDFSTLDEEPERFSEDLDWMPRVVMIAKSTLVWLDQLSKKYERDIRRLDQIPDQELNILANCGFTALWLIGLWERSEASKRIKQIMGNPDAESSAYALDEYEIAESLGGYQAYENLKDRCAMRGVRLASDMVPNHTALDAKWVYDHPDWFLQLPYSPFPSYTFNGPNLSNRHGVGIYLEDHYYDHSDAAVVFKRVDFESGETRFIYHGNDGTSMPWNDTAQINYMIPHVREAVIQSILHVARMFPVIRFDAAMLLAKKHYQRLWFPEPGSGGGIPSRAENGMTRKEFDRHMPEEFWREVVERIRQEVPDTLLLAEAFWFMEGYFVRSLGMHRVYNSAFMNMLKMEENTKYRKVIKDTLEFEPEILKRYVNFMNNPDEETAVAQFGKGDKYFGVCIMLVTMPGLPMFGHGQIEGFTEKYGMEYRRAMHDEQVDEVLFERHRREVFPLMKRRHLFANVQNYLLYDFFADGGGVNEDVFAYSNRFGDERALVIFNNKFATAAGRIHRSAAFLNKQNSSDRGLIHHTLQDGLQLSTDKDVFCIYRDAISGLEFVHQSQSMAERGLYFKLHAYECRVFLDFRFAKDHEDQRYATLAYELGGKGVPSVDEAIKDLLLRPLHDAFYHVCNPEIIGLLADQKKTGDPAAQALVEELATPWENFADKARKELGLDRPRSADGADVAGQAVEAAEEIGRLVKQDEKKPEPDDTAPTVASKETGMLSSPPEAAPPAPPVFFLWRLLAPLHQEDPKEASIIDRLRLERVIRQAFAGAGLPENVVEEGVMYLRVLTLHGTALGAEQSPYALLAELLDHAGVQQAIGMHEHDGVVWFRKEGFESLAWYLLAAHYVTEWLRSRSTVEPFSDVSDQAGIVREWLGAMADSEYRVGRLLTALESSDATPDEEDDEREAPPEDSDEKKPKSASRSPG